MRLKIFGIPKFALLFFSGLPALVWCSFHLNVATYHERSFAWWVALSLILGLVFPFFFCRGIFKIRFLVYSFLFAEIGFELLSSVAIKDFGRLGGALVALGVGLWLSFWTERRVEAADLNPRSHWFEGDPLLHSRVKVQIFVEGKAILASLRLIDERGFFVFLDHPVDFLPKQQIPFQLEYRNLKVEGESRLNAVFRGERLGFGLQFSPKDLYHFSQYTACVQRLKGEGL